jgi:methionyl aminopeptidase
MNLKFFMKEYSSKNYLKSMKKSGKKAALILHKLEKCIKPGMNTLELNKIGKDLMKNANVKSACYHYKDCNQKLPLFPSHICVSINNSVVHGVCSKNIFIKNGDIVSLDVSISYKGFFGDNAKTIPVGKVSKEKKKLINVTKKSLIEGIKICKPGKKVADISEKIQKVVEKNGMNVVKEFAGHGIGKKIHEFPVIPNFKSSNKSPILKKGMILAIEPIVNLGSSKIYFSKDGWSTFTKDGLSSAHFEHTILITETNPKILTNL